MPGTAPAAAETAPIGGPPMTITQPFLIPADEQRRDPWRIVAGGERTGGLVTIGDARLPPRTPGPGRHTHSREDEAIYVTSGLLTVEVGSQRHQVGPGSLIWLPRGIPHTFANLSGEPVRAVGVITPSGLENMFAEIAAYLAALTGPPDPQAITAINAKYGVSPADGSPLS
jgi:mannose-6-phosphate isomerase-like protein (cupin superfamily)